MKKVVLISIVFVSMLLLSCERKFDDTPKTSAEDKEITELVVPEEFDFSTSKAISLTIIDPNVYVKYEIYSAEYTEPGGLLSSLYIPGGKQTVPLTIPKSVQELRITRDAAGSRQSYYLTIDSDHITFDYSNYAGAQKTLACTEKLYAVNGDGGFYEIDNESVNYSTVTLSNLTGGGSIACAVDKANRIVYYNTGTTLRYYDIDAGTFHVRATGNPFNGNYPRMEFNNTTGELYIAKNEQMYIIDPMTNAVLKNIPITGMQSPVGGGDLAISLDGTIYMCAFSGLYRVDMNSDTTSANAVRISAENLPFQPTSMAIDRNDRLYLATNDANSQLIIMDKFDGAWQVAQTYNHKINDLSSLPCAENELDQTDSDGDGIIDQHDDFPDDANKAFETFTPSELGWGSLGFEDLWPAQGDYDFNDLAINYRFISVQNASNEVVELRCEFKILSLNASYKNGFGVEFPFSPSIVNSVTGQQLTENIVTLSANGTEAGQTNAVIIPFDDAFKHGNYGECVTQPDDKVVVTVQFTSPQSLATIGTAPFNPFIFIDSDRGKEVHLSNHTPTSLGNTSLFGTIDDDSGGGVYYKNSTGLPWAIDIIHNFRVPRSSRAINRGYNKFGQWAESGGGNYVDWYKDNAGYRNTSDLCTD